MLKHTFLTILAFVCFRALAQDVELVQVSFDSGNKLMEIDAVSEERLKLFPEIIGFQSAKAYKITDESYTIEIISNGKPLRRNLSASDFTIFRSKMDARIVDLATNMPPSQPNVINNQTNIIDFNTSKELDQSGRRRLLGATLGLSLIYYGPAFSYIIDVQNSSQAGGVYLLIGGAGFLVPFLLTEDKRVTKAMGNLALSGGIAGITQGMALFLAFNGDDFNDIDNIKPFLGLGMLGSISGLLAGYHYADKYDMNVGKASMIGALGGVIGPVSGLFVNGLFNGGVRSGSLLFIGGGVAGVYLGDRLSTLHNYTEGDANLLGTVTGLSFITAYSSVIATNAESLFDNTVTNGVGLLALTTGVLLGDKLVQPYDFETNDANLIGLGTLAGGAVGLGIGLIAEAKLGLPLTASLGASAGFALTYSAISRKQVRISQFSKNLNMGLTSISVPNGLNKGYDYAPGLRIGYKL